MRKWWGIGIWGIQRVYFVDKSFSTKARPLWVRPGYPGMCTEEEEEEGNSSFLAANNPLLLWSVIISSMKQINLQTIINSLQNSIPCFSSWIQVVDDELVILRYWFAWSLILPRTAREFRSSWGVSLYFKTAKTKVVICNHEDQSY